MTRHVSVLHNLQNAKLLLIVLLSLTVAYLCNERPADAPEDVPPVIGGLGGIITC